MNDSIEFTPKEKYLISLFQDPDGLFKRAVSRWLWFLVPSLGLVAYSLSSGDISYGIIGYGVLLFRAVYLISRAKRGYTTTAAIFRKYEAQLQAKQNAA
jgi:hypothetical protein